MSKIIAQAVQNCVDAINAFEEVLAERGITLDEWLSNPELRGRKDWNNKANDKEKAETTVS